ncbi:MAG TPA: hypothetical protein VI320_37975 [Terracidiphilus sp.]
MSKLLGWAPGARVLTLFGRGSLLRRFAPARLSGINAEVIRYGRRTQ